VQHRIDDALGVAEEREQDMDGLDLLVVAPDRERR
jgi:hypothetical protein